MIELKPRSVQKHGTVWSGSHFMLKIENPRKKPYNDRSCCVPKAENAVGWISFRLES